MESKNNQLSGFPKYKTSGFTLVEILVSLAVFSIIMGAVLGIFTSAIKSQRRILSEQQLVDQASYFEEYISRVLRMAQKDLTGSCITRGYNYQLIGASEIRFLDYENRCRRFFIDSTGIPGSYTIKVQRATNDSYANLILQTSFALFSDNFNVNSFRISGSGLQQGDLIQPSLTVFFRVDGRDGVKIQSQTTISQRNLDITY